MSSWSIRTSLFPFIAACKQLYFLPTPKQATGWDFLYCGSVSLWSDKRLKGTLEWTIAGDLNWGGLEAVFIVLWEGLKTPNITLAVDWGQLLTMEFFSYTFIPWGKGVSWFGFSHHAEVGGASGLKISLSSMAFRGASPIVLLAKICRWQQLRHEAVLCIMLQVHLYIPMLLFTVIFKPASTHFWARWVLMGQEI